MLTGLGITYLLVCAACLITHNLVIVGGDALGLPLPMCVAASFVIVVLLGYALHSRFTFHVRAGWDGLARYTLAMLPNLPLSLALIWFFSRWIGLPMPVAAPIATIAMLVLNFFLSRWAIAGRLASHGRTGR